MQKNKFLNIPVPPMDYEESECFDEKPKQYLKLMMREFGITINANPDDLDDEGCRRILRGVWVEIIARENIQ